MVECFDCNLETKNIPLSSRVDTTKQPTPFSSHLLRDSRDCLSTNVSDGLHARSWRNPILYYAKDLQDRKKLPHGR